jgi:hypothetical protein
MSVLGWFALPNCALAVAPRLAAARVVIILIALGLWHWSQRLLACRNPPVDCPTPTGSPLICDGIHTLTAKLNRKLLDSPATATALLVSSSLLIDLLGIYLAASAIFGKTFAPFLGLFLLFTLRQFCQAFCPLPPPPGMIWRSTGFPSLLVTYGTSCDLFFSGHTAIAVYGAATLAVALGPIGVVVGCAIVAFEIVAVLVLRAHYTMDVFAGAVTALYIH